MSGTANFEIKEVIVRVVTVSVNDRLDLFSAANFRTKIQTLLEQGATKLVIDLSQTPFLDSAGIAALVSALKQCRQRDGDVRLVSPQSEAVRRIFELTKFDRVFEMYPSTEEAVKGFHR